MRYVKYPLFRTILVGLWFSLIFLLVYGSGVSLHYKVSPVLIFLSFLLLLKNFKIVSYNNSNLFKIFIGLIIITFISSYHYFYHFDHRATYLQYLCYSISGFVLAITSYHLVYKDIRMYNIIYYLNLIFFVVGIYRFFRASSQLEYLYANTAYYYILMPLPLLISKSSRYVFNIIVLLVSTILCILSIKRGAIVAVSILWIVYLFNILKNNKKVFLYIMVLLFFGVSFISEKVQIADLAESAIRIKDRLFAIGEDGGSGRVDIINTFLKNDLEDLFKFPEIFIGNGFEGTYYKYGDLSSMHNDFLEVFYTLGLLGLVLLISFYYRIYGRMKILLKNNDNLLTPYMSTALLFFIFSFVGANFNYFNLSAPLFLSIGALEAAYKKKYNIV